MGMDSVELVLAFEEAFDVEIPDADSEKLVTVGDVVDYIGTVLARKGRTADPTVIYFRVREIIIEILNPEPRKITRSARFVEDLGMS